ncbi:MFS transporter [Vulcanisaeta thermophila]|uniref:MFS transporter n=1 Tax=Vulcanisaeta thermophila TaxID=867917 RepID=UPI000853605C|nr:MFS transporter [Vulcanisaeta thermophila]
MKRNALVLILTRAIRSAAFGYLAFVVPLYLKSLGFSAVLVGIYFMVATISSAVLVLVSGFLGDIIGRRDSLMIMSSLFVVAMAIYSFTDNKLIIFLTSILGVTTGVGGGGGAGGGPVAPLLTSLLADHTEPSERVRVFSINTSVAVSSSFAGSLMASLLLSLGFSDQFLFRLSLALSLISLALLLLVDRDPRRVSARSVSSVVRLRSVGNVARISIAGSLGSLGLGMVTPLLPLWFRLYLHATEVEVGEVYTVSYLASVVATLMASHVGKFLGRVRGIALFRSFSTLLFVVMALVPNFIIDAVLYVLRASLYMLTLPLRQSVSVEVIDEDERARGLSITGLARRLPYGIGSSLAGLFMDASLYALSMIVGGVIATMDPILYYVFFRKLDSGVRSNH